jgi:hypothetical protein
MEVARRGGDASVAVVPLCHVDSRDRAGQKGVTTGNWTQGSSLLWDESGRRALPRPTALKEPARLVVVIAQG